VAYAYSRDIVYQTTYYVGLYDVSTSGTPALRATLEYGTEADYAQSPFATWTGYKLADVLLEGDLAWVSIAWRYSGYRSLVAYDCSVPSAIRSGTSNDDYGPVQLVRSGQYLYTLRSANGLWHGEVPWLGVLDITEPLSPTIVASCPISGCLDATLAPGGDLIYAASGSSLDVVDIADPLAPYLASHLALPATAVCVANGHAFVAAGSLLAILDVGVPAQPTQVGQWYSVGSVVRMAVASDHVYLSDGSDTLRIADISDPAWPKIVGTYVCSTPIVDLGAEGRYVYLATFDAVTVVDVYDPDEPVLARVAQGFAEGAVRQVRVVGEWLYVLSEGPDLTMFPLYNPASPSWAPAKQLRIPLLENLEQVSRDYAYVCHPYKVDDEWGWHWNTDVRPIPLHGGPSPEPLTFYGERVVVKADMTRPFIIAHSFLPSVEADGMGVSIYDTSDIAHPVCVRDLNSYLYGGSGGCPSYFSGEMMSLSGGFDLVYGRTNHECNHSIRPATELRLLDVSDPSAVRVVGEFGFDIPEQAQVVGDLLFEAHGDGGLAIHRLVRLPRVAHLLEAEECHEACEIELALRTDEAASSCVYIAGPSGIYVLFSPPQAGEYYVWVRAMDSGPTPHVLRLYTYWNYITSGLEVELQPIAGEWNWQRAREPLRLQAGEELIDAFVPDPDVRLDCVLITDDPYFVPSAITPCGGILNLPLVMR
jgi:hypothetical protein